MIGYSSTVANSQLIPIAPRQSYDPLTYGQAFTGPAFWPRQGVYNVPPVMPSAATANSMAPAAIGASGVTLPSSMSGSGNPFHPTKSPLIMALLFLGGGLLLLQYVHYGKKG